MADGIKKFKQNLKKLVKERWNVNGDTKWYGKKYYIKNGEGNKKISR